MSNITRTPDEIVKRIKEIKQSGSDFFGVQQAHLVFALEYKDAKQFLSDDYTEAEFNEARVSDRDALLSEAKEYMKFAVGKMLDERGLSAKRSVDHYSGWIWLLTNDKIHECFVSAEYGWYGRNQLRLAAEVLGFPEFFDELVSENA